MNTHPLFTKTTLAILAVFIIVIVALLKGINTGVTTSGIAIIAGLGGYVLGRKQSPK